MTTNVAFLTADNNADNSLTAMPTLPSLILLIKNIMECELSAYRQEEEDRCFTLHTKGS